MDISFANQLFINGEFVNATSGKKQKLYNPHDESVICEVSVEKQLFYNFENKILIIFPQVEVGVAADVDKAVKAAHKAYHEGDWGRMSARERGSLLFKLGKVANKLSKI